MMHAHKMASLGSGTFFLSLASRSAILVSADGSMKLPLDSLDARGLLAAKNMAHNQYVNAMIQGSGDLDMHRATLNFLSKETERKGSPVARPHDLRGRKTPGRSKANRKVCRAA